ncbi:hypothetical protein GA0074692_6825 [Micromonospora pallida]|uniref:Homeodomain-like domain-containing protein n=1 Tax=Micromonospora pallida TaxID=145854 RepID=A0A1C6TNL1_9ACTN|nr:helix-turn-helix domain-containing protein [Micromonospora pallida]SCL43331.1 hypothetical protein GA0074692_6825 [Micromonospora pallida]
MPPKPNSYAGSEETSDRHTGLSGPQARHRQRTPPPALLLPEAIAAAKAANHRGYLSRGYIRGSVSNQRAPRHGFDEVVVDRAVDGPRPAQMTLPEIHAAIDRLTARGESAREIAKRLGVTTRTVTRQRARRRASIRTG